MARRRRGQFPTPKKEKGLWKIRYRTDQAQPDGTVRRVKKTKCLGKTSEMTLREAKKEAQRFLQPINDVEPGIEFSGRTVDELIEAWRDVVKPALKPSTQAQYEWAITRWLSPRVGRKPLGDLEKVDVQRLLTSASATLAGESVRDLRNRIRGVLTHGEDWGWIREGSNPARGRLRLPPAVPTRRRRILSPSQLSRLLDELAEPYRTIVKLAALSGLRKGEIEGLRWRCVRDRTVVVEQAVHRGRISSPKTASSRRTVAIGPGLEADLLRWRRRTQYPGADDFVFALRTSGPIDLHNVAARHLKPAALRAGVPAACWHDLRHTYATWSRAAGAPAETLRDQLGHSSVQITLDVYSHYEDRVRQAQAVESFVLKETRDGPKAFV